MSETRKQSIWRPIQPWLVGGGLTLLSQAIPPKIGIVYPVTSWIPLVAVAVGIVGGWWIVRRQASLGFIGRLGYMVLIMVLFNEPIQRSACAFQVQEPQAVLTQVVQKHELRLWWFSERDWVSRGLGWNKQYFLDVALPPWTPGAAVVFSSTDEFRHPRWRSVFERAQGGDPLMVSYTRGLGSCLCVSDIQVKKP